jgi:hypothetical protein
MKAGNDKTALGWSLVISGLMHMLSGVVASAATSSMSVSAVPAIPPPVEFIVIAPEPVVPGPPAAERARVPEAVVVPSQEDFPRAPRAPSVAVGTMLPNLPDAPKPDELVPREADVKPPVSIGVRGGLRLDPRAVAMAAIAAEGPSAPHVSAVDAPAMSDAQRAEELNERHSRFLNETANAQAWITRKEPPNFVPRKDGSYVYRGHAFSAQIRPDGTIVFSDRDGINFDQLGTSDAQSLGARFSFDLTDGAYRRRGADPYQAERDYVLRGSEELRDKLAAEHRVHEGERALLRLTGRLERTWTSGRDAPARRRALFKLWDDCSDDDVGARARAAILAFVVDRLPAGSAEAFTPEELDQLNAKRRSRDPFRPYP